MAEVALRALLPAQSANGATSVTIVGEVPVSFAQTEYQVQRITLTSPTVVTGVATQNFTVNVRQVHAGTPGTTLATTTFALNTNLAVEVPFVMSSNVTTQLLINAGDVIDVQLVQNGGTGLAVPVGIVAAVELA
jgi:hypothetical protein